MNNTVSPDRPVGPLVSGWTTPDTPFPDGISGQYAHLERLEAEKHAALLFRAFEGHDHVWDYLPYGPFSSASQYYRWAREAQDMTDTIFYAIRNLETGAYEGVASYLRNNPASGSIEVGHINMSPALQNTRAATETMYLMMAWAFEAGYRRYEWKCDALNMPSRRAAQRLGLSYEGVFRQATIVKKRNRDTAWFAAIDQEWTALKEAFSAWLNPSNFTSEGRQIERLSDLTRLVRPHDDPSL